MGLKQKIRGSQTRRVKSWPNVAPRQLQSRKKVQEKGRDIAWKAKIFPPYWRQAAKTYVATSHSVVRQETIEISKQKSVFAWIFSHEVDWCLQDCDIQCLQTTVSINLWKIFAGHTGDWFDVKLLRYVPLSFGTLCKVSFSTVWKLRWLPTL